MEQRMLEYYERELQHLRESAAEFARAYPKIAGRLALEEFECADPYVERMLEGFAFLAARVQLKIDAEFPRFTHHLLESLYPAYLSPTPSMLIAKLEPDLGEGALAEGFTVPSGTLLRSMLGPEDETPCVYRTAQDTTLWPLKIEQARYYSSDLATLDLHHAPRQTKAAIRLRLSCTANLKFNELSLDRLRLFLRGGSDEAVRLLEQLIADGLGVAIRPAQQPTSREGLLPAQALSHAGMAEGEALLPGGPRSFDGYRLLHEYFTLPQRFQFVELAGLSEHLRNLEGDQVDLIFLLGRIDNRLERVLGAEDFALFCTPAINLFPKDADRIQLSEAEHEFHVVPDRTKPLDYEVWSVQRVIGYGESMNIQRQFRPFYSAKDPSMDPEDRAYFATHRRARLKSAREKERGTRTSYAGSEVFLSIVDARNTPYRKNLRTLQVETMCTNRDLPLTMPLGGPEGDLTLESGAPVEQVKCLVGPTRPQPSYAEGAMAWRLVSHLSLNYLSLCDEDPQQGATSLRELLSLYCPFGDRATWQHVEGVRNVQTSPIVRRLEQAGPPAFARGLQVDLTLDSAAFEGSGAFLLGAVLERFFAKYVSINSFTETLLHTVDRGQIHRWSARIGKRALL